MTIQRMIQRILLFTLGCWAFINPLPIAAQSPTCTVAEVTPLPDGPYYQQIYRATSLDGFMYEASNTMLLNHATAPDGVNHNGATWLYYLNGQPTQQGLWVAQPDSNGHFQPVECITFDGQLNPQATDPDIVALDNGQYRLFYSDEQGQIVSAISTDGVNFTGEQTILTGSNLAAPTAVKDEADEWLLAYKQADTVLFASSVDGVNFTSLDGSLPANGGTPELLTLADGSIRLLMGNLTLQSYRSTDGGQSWVVESPSATIVNQNEAAQGAQHPSAINLNETNWSLFYAVTNEGDELMTISGTILLQSRDDHQGTDIYLSEELCGTLGDTPSQVTTSANGQFEFAVEAGVTYQCLQAKRNGFLMGQRISPNGEIGTITLLGGDVNGDNVINVFDLALIAANYDTANPELDLNGDGLVDIFDLTMTAINYNKSGPVE